MSLIKSISGIRGTIGGIPGDNLTPIDIVESAAAFAKWLSQRPVPQKVIIGRDGRISGKMVEDLVVNTIIASGIDVVNLGLSTTPAVEVFVQNNNAGAGIIITASHNPKEWNALKFLNEKGEFISAEDGRYLLELIESRNYNFVGINRLGKLEIKNNSIEEHINAVLAYPLVDPELIRAKKFHIVVDAINSTGAIAVPMLLDKLGCTYTVLNKDITGDFSHNPEPLPENLKELCREVADQKADMGIAVDPDVDRLSLIMNDGQLLGEEYTLVMIADYFLKELGSGNTVSNLSSTRALRDVTESSGGLYSASAVGEVNVVKKMKETNAVIGGEGNGGIIVPDFHYGRDAVIGIALALTYMAKYDISLTDLKKTYPQYTIIKDKINLSENMDIDSIFSMLEANFPDADIDKSDGIKFDLSEGWVHFRKSNTEPIMRIYSESKSEEKAKQLADIFKQKINSAV